MGTSAETHRKEMEIESNEKIAQENLQFQKDKLQYDMDLQKQIFAREDSSYQRTVNDMRAAGISPLAMQGTNGAGEAVATTAPQNQMNYDYMSGMSTDVERISQVLQGISSITNSLNTIQETKSKEIQNQYLARSLQMQQDNLEADIIAKHYNNADSHMKYLYNQQFGIHSGMSEDERRFAILANALGVAPSYHNYDKTFESSNMKYSRNDTLNTPFINSSYANWYLARSLGSNFVDFAKELLKTKLKAPVFGGKKQKEDPYPDLPF